MGKKKKGKALSTLDRLRVEAPDFWYYAFDFAATNRIEKELESGGFKRCTVGGITRPMLAWAGMPGLGWLYWLRHVRKTGLTNRLSDFPQAFSEQGDRFKSRKEEQRSLANSLESELWTDNLRRVLELSGFDTRGWKRKLNQLKKVSSTLAKSPEGRPPTSAAVVEVVLCLMIQEATGESIRDVARELGRFLGLTRRDLIVFFREVEERAKHPLRFDSPLKAGGFKSSAPVL